MHCEPNNILISYCREKKMNNDLIEKNVYHIEINAVYTRINNGKIST